VFHPKNARIPQAAAHGTRDPVKLSCLENTEESAQQAQRQDAEYQLRDSYFPLDQEHQQEDQPDAQDAREDGVHDVADFDGGQSDLDRPVQRYVDHEGSHRADHANA
jgi:hypothetical protein